MNTTKRWTTGIALCLLLGAGAVCAGDDDISGAALVDPQINPASAKPNWLWIGERVNTAQACPGQPMLPNWKIQPLFCEPLDPEHPDNGQCVPETPNQIPPGLRGFCSYEFAIPDVTVPMGDITKLNPRVEISFSDDGGANFSRPEIRELGVMQDSKILVRVFLTGSLGPYGRVWRLRCSDPIYISLIDAEMPRIKQRSAA